MLADDVADTIKTNVGSIGWTVQSIFFNDTKKANDSFIVVRNDSTGELIKGLTGEYYVTISIIGAINKFMDVNKKANDIMMFFLDNPNHRWGYAKCVSGLSSPVFTADKRLVSTLNYLIYKVN